MASCVPFLLHIPLDRSVQAWRRYDISCFSGPRQIREKKKKLVPKLLEEEKKAKMVLFFFFFCFFRFCISLLLRMLHYGLSCAVGSSVVTTSKKNWREIRRGTCCVIFLGGQKASKGMKSKKKRKVLLGVWNPSDKKGFHDYILALSGLKWILLTWETTWKVSSSWFYRRVEGRSPKSARWKIFARAVSEKCYFFFCPYCNYALCSNYALSLLMTTSIYHRISFFFFTALHT